MNRRRRRPANRNNPKSVFLLLCSVSTINILHARGNFHCSSLIFSCRRRRRLSSSNDVEKLSLFLCVFLVVMCERLFVCSFVCLLVRLFVCSLARSLAGSVLYATRPPAEGPFAKERARFAECACAARSGDRGDNDASGAGCACDDADVAARRAIGVVRNRGRRRQECRQQRR